MPHSQWGPEELRREWLRELTREQYGKTVPEWSAVRCGRRPDPTAWEAGLIRRAELERAIGGVADDYDDRPDLLVATTRTVTIPERRAERRLKPPPQVELALFDEPEEAGDGTYPVSQTGAA